jgi:hypothetical protein
VVGGKDAHWRRAPHGGDARRREADGDGADERPSAALEWSVRYPVSLQSSWMQTGNADGTGLLWGRSLRWPATGCGAPLEEEGGALAAVAGA